MSLLMLNIETRANTWKCFEIGSFNWRTNTFNFTENVESDIKKLAQEVFSENFVENDYRRTGLQDPTNKFTVSKKKLQIMVIYTNFLEKNRVNRKCSRRFWNF